MSRFVTLAIASLARHVEDTGDGRVLSPRRLTGLILPVASEATLARAGRMFARSVGMIEGVARFPFDPHSP